jgi:hypothetical protein
LEFNCGLLEHLLLSSLYDIHVVLFIIFYLNIYISYLIGFYISIIYRCVAMSFDGLVCFGDIDPLVIIENIYVLLTDIQYITQNVSEYKKIDINGYCKLVLDIEENDENEISTEFIYDYILWLYCSDVVICYKDFSSKNIDIQSITDYFASCIKWINFRNAYRCINNCNRIAVYNNFCMNCLGCIGKCVCLMCMESREEGDVLVKNICGHVYHIKCYLENGKNCLFCK